MAATVTVLNRTKLGHNFNVAICTWAWDATYPAGGEAATANQLGMTTISAVIPVSSNTAGYVYNWDAANSKLQAYYSNNDSTADGPLIDIAAGDTAMLTGIVTTLLVVGI